MATRKREIPVGLPLPPPRRSNTVDGTTDEEARGGYPGNHLFKDSCRPMKLYWPPDESRGARRGPARAAGPAEAVTTFRLLGEPAYDPARPEMFAGRFQPAHVYNEFGQPDLTAFIERYMVFRIPSTKDTRGGAVFAIYDPQQSPDAQAKWDTPPMVLMKACKQAKEAEIGERYWARMIDKDSPKALKWPNWTYVSYGLVYQYGPDQVYVPPLGLHEREKSLVLDLGAGAGRGIWTLLQLPRTEHIEAVRDGTIDLETYPEADALFRMRNPVALDRGVFFRAFKMESADPRPAHRREVYNGKRAWLLDVPAEEVTGGKGYHVYACRQFSLPDPHDPRRRVVYTPTIDPQHHETLWRKTITPLHDQLLFPSFEEQVALICKFVRRPDGDYCQDLLEYAFQDHDDWMATVEHCLGGVTRRRTTLAPAADAAEEERRTATRAGLRPGGRAGATEEEDEDDLDEEETRGTSRRAPAARTTPSRRRPEPVDVDDEDDDLDDETAVLSPARSAAVPPVDEDEDEDEVTSLPGDDLEDEDDDRAVAAPPAPVTTRRGPRPLIPAVGDPEDDDEEDAVAATDDDEEDTVGDHAAPLATAPPAPTVAKPVSRDGGGPARRSRRAPLEFEEPPPPRAEPTAAPEPAPGPAKLEALKRTKLKGKGRPPAGA